MGFIFFIFMMILFFFLNSECCHILSLKNIKRLKILSLVEKDSFNIKGNEPFQIYHLDETGFFQFYHF